MGNTVKYQFCTPSDYPKYVRFLKGHVVSEVLEQAMEAAEHKDRRIQLWQVPHRGGIRKCGYGEGLQGQFKFVHSFCSENQAGFLSALRKNLSRVFRAAQCESRVLTLEEAEKDQGIHIDRSDIVGRKRIRISELWSGGIGTVLYYPRNLDVIHEMVEARSESKRFFSYMELCDKLSDPVVIGPRQAGIMYVGDYGDMVSVHSSPAETPLWRTDIEKSNRNLFDYEALS